MVQQAALPFKYEASKTSGATAFAGLPLYLELSQVVGLRELVEQHMAARGDGQGWQDADVITFIHRTDQHREQGTAELILAKHRNGPLRSFKLHFRGDRIKFYDIGGQEGK